MRKVTLPINFGNYDFKELAKKEKNAALKVRYFALSHIASGKTVLEAAAIVHKSSRMLHRWLNCLEQFGIEGLKDKKGRGRKLSLSIEKEAEFKNIVSAYLKENNQTKIIGHEIQQLLKEYYGISCTLPTAYNILSRLSLNIQQLKNKKIKSTRSLNI